MEEHSIPVLLDGLVDRILATEDLELEFKKASGGLPSSLGETVSAFANTNGGWIVLGVDDSKHVAEIVGISNAEARLQDFWNIMHNRSKICRTVCGPNDTEIQTIAGKEVIVIRVPAAPLRDRPIYIGHNPLTGTYVRGHAGDFHCNERDVKRMMRDDADVTLDVAILPQLDWEAFDRDAVSRYRQLFQNANPGHPRNTFDDKRFLRAIDAFRRDSQTGAEGMTVAGLLLFGQPEAIREWRPSHLIDFRLAPAASGWAGGWDDRIVYEGNLLEAFKTIYPKLVADLPIPFRLDGITRASEGPIHIALREALVNFLVHADYSETAASLVTRSAEGYRCRNPGNSRVPVSDLADGDRSDPRNPVIVRAFRQIGLAEQAGTGMARIYGAWRESRLFPPSIAVDTERYEFLLLMPYRHLVSAEDRSWLGALGSQWQGDCKVRSGTTMPLRRTRESWANSGSERVRSGLSRRPSPDFGGKSRLCNRLVPMVRGRRVGAIAC